MTDYTKTKLNSSMKKLSAVKAELKELKDREAALVDIVKTTMRDAHLDTWTSTGIKATIYQSVRMTLDKEKLAKYLKDEFGVEKIPNDLYSVQESVSLKVSKVA